MPRKGQVTHRAPQLDPVYNNDLVMKFICSMMWEGKRSTAQRVFYGAMDQVAKKTNDDALKVFKKAIENVKPVLEVKTRRVGGANYQVPVEVNPFRRQSLAIRWLLQYARDLAQRRVRLLRRGGVHARTDTSLLRALLQGRRCALHAHLLAAFADELINRGHLLGS